MTRHFAIIAVLCTCVLSVCLASAADAHYTAAPGPYQVAAIDSITLHDAARNKDLLVKIYYPIASGERHPFPVIIFSHGLYGSKNGYGALGEYWASYGYVCIHPSHVDSLRDGSYRAGLRAAIQDPRLWQERPEDIHFLLDQLSELERISPQLRGLLDHSRIGVGGHSYGAYTTQAIGGATVTMPDSTSPRSFADKRVKAIVILSPQGEGQMGLTKDSWNDLTRPMLAMYGSRDFGSQRQTPTWRSQSYSSSPAGDKYDVEVQGATHMTFAGRDNNDMFKCVMTDTLAFWDAYIKDDPAAKRWLQSDALACNGLGRVARK